MRTFVFICFCDLCYHIGYEAIFHILFSWSFNDSVNIESVHSCHRMTGWDLVGNVRGLAQVLSLRLPRVTELKLGKAEALR
jgi:hypothetical protein